jgi:hypothetical protein
MVSLTATAASGSTFAGWSGACAGAGACNVTMSSNQNVTATFSNNAALKPPVLSKLLVLPASFRAATKANKRKHKHTGATISYTDSEPAMTTFTVRSITPGVVVGKRCVAPAKHKSHRKHVKRCTSSALVGHFKKTDSAGKNSLTFNGVLNGHRLAPHRYRLEVVAKNANGTSQVLHAVFSIVS